MNSSRSFSALVPQAMDFMGTGLLREFVVGVTDTLDTIAFCIEGNVKVGQLVEIVKKYLRENPDTWNEAGRDLVIDALSRAFPCKR